MPRSQDTSSELSVHRVSLIVSFLAGGLLLAAALTGCEGKLTGGARLILVGIDGGPGLGMLPPPPVREPDPTPVAPEPDPGEPAPDPIPEPDPVPEPTPDPPAPDPTPAPPPSPSTDLLCQPCAGQGQCGGSKNYCLQTEAGESFCGVDCTTSACPADFGCEDLGNGIAQCVPQSLTCRDTVQPPPGSPPPGGGGGAPVPPSADIATQEQHLLDLVNADRAASGRSCAKPLLMLPAASDVARGHSQWMADNFNLSHDDPTGDPFTRLQRAGVGFSGAGENAACGNGCASVDQAEFLFMSEGPGGGHYENILNCNWTHVGIGVARDSNGGIWVTQDFLSR